MSMSSTAQSVVADAVHRLKLLTELEKDASHAAQSRAALLTELQTVVRQYITENTGGAAPQPCCDCMPLKLVVEELFVHQLLKGTTFLDRAKNSIASAFKGYEEVAQRLWEFIVALPFDASQDKIAAAIPATDCTARCRAWIALALSKPLILKSAFSAEAVIALRYGPHAFLRDADDVSLALGILHGAWHIQGAAVNEAQFDLFGGTATLPPVVAVADEQTEGRAHAGSDRLRAGSFGSLLRRSSPRTERKSPRLAGIFAAYAAQKEEAALAAPTPAALGSNLPVLTTTLRSTSPAPGAAHARHSASGPASTSAAGSEATADAPTGPVGDARFEGIEAFEADSVQEVAVQRVAHRKKHDSDSASLGGKKKKKKKRHHHHPHREHRGSSASMGSTSVGADSTSTLQSGEQSPSSAFSGGGGDDGSEQPGAIPAAGKSEDDAEEVSPPAELASRQTAARRPTARKAAAASEVGDNVEPVTDGSKAAGLDAETDEPSLAELLRRRSQPGPAHGSSTQGASLRQLASSALTEAIVQAAAEAAANDERAAAERAAAAVAGVTAAPVAAPAAATPATPATPAAAPAAISTATTSTTPAERTDAAPVAPEVDRPSEVVGTETTSGPVSPCSVTATPIEISASASPLDAAFSSAPMSPQPFEPRDTEAAATAAGAATAATPTSAQPMHMTLQERLASRLLAKLPIKGRRNSARTDGAGAAAGGGGAAVEASSAPQQSLPRPGTFRAKSGRTSGPDNYQFGDVTRTAVRGLVQGLRDVTTTLVDRIKQPLERARADDAGDDDFCDDDEFELLREDSEGEGGFLNLALDQNSLLKMMSKISELSEHHTLEEQDDLCNGCQNPIPIVDADDRTEFARRCEFDGYWYCHSCHHNETDAIPARILANADSRPYPVACRTKQFLTLVANEPVFTVSLLDDSPENHKAAALRVVLEEINDLRSTLAELMTTVEGCKRVDHTKLRKQLWPREHLFEATELFCLLDLQELANSVNGLAENTLRMRMRSVIASCREHIRKCDQCSPLIRRG